MNPITQVEECWANPPKTLLYRPHSLIKHLSLFIVGIADANYKTIIQCPDCAYPLSIIDEVTPILTDEKKYTITRDRVITCLWCYTIERLHEMWGRTYIIDKNITAQPEQLIYDEEAETYYINPSTPQNIKKRIKKQHKVVIIQADQDISDEAGTLLFGPVGLHDKSFILKKPTNPTKAMNEWHDKICKVLRDKYEDGEVTQKPYKASSFDAALKIPTTV